MKRADVRAGLYIDSQGVYLMQVGKSGGQLKVLGASFVPTSFTSETDSVARTKGIREAVSQAFKNAMIQTRDVYLAMPGEDSIMRCFELPLLPKKEQRNAIRFEAQKYVPFEIRDLYFDYEVTPDEPRKKMKVVVSAVKKLAVEAVAGPLHAEGLRIMGTELVSQSIIRSYVHLAAGSKGAMTAVLCANENRTAEFVICKNGTVYSHRHLALAHLAHSEELDTNYLLAEVRLCFDSFMKIFRNEAVTRLCLFSGRTAERLVRFADILQQEFGIQVEQQRTLSFQGVRLAEESSGMITAFGLAARDFMPAKETAVNLYSSGGLGMKAEEAPVSEEEQQARLKKLGIKIGFLVVGLLVLLFVFQFNRLTGKRNEVLRMKASYSKSAAANADMPYESLLSKNEETAARAWFASSLIDRRIFMTLKMNELAKAVPQNIVLTRMIYTNETPRDGSNLASMKFEGYVSSAEGSADLSAINKMISALSSSKEFMRGFQEVKISSAKKATVRSRQTIIFVVDCVTQRVGT